MGLFSEHPKGLRVLFGTEAAERFSFYGMRSGLKPYVAALVAAKVLAEDPSGIYANYTGLVYLTPVLGGMLADVMLGRRKAVIIGGILMAIGHFLMAFPAALLYALGFLVLGNGLFKGNITSQIKDQYPPKDARFERANSLFYLGINLGSIFGILLCGTLANNDHPHWAFSVAGVVMLMSLARFIWGQKHLQGGFPIGRTVADGASWFTNRDLRDVVLWVIGGALVIFGALQMGWLYSPAFLSDMPLTLLGYQIVLMSAVTFGLQFGIERLFTKAQARPAPLTKEDWFAIAAVIIMCVMLVFFFAPFNQAGDRMNDFAKLRTDRVVFGFEIPESAAQVINPIFICLVIVFMASWLKGDTKRPFLLQTIGMFIMAAGSLVMMYAESLPGKVSPLWITGVYILQSTAEVMIVPVAMAVVGKVAPARVRSTLLGVFFLSIFTGNKLSGSMGDIIDSWAKSHPGVTPNYWFIFAIGGAISAGVLLVLSPLLMRWAGKRLTN